MSPFSYQFNITWLNIIIVKEYLSGFISLQRLCLLFNMPNQTRNRMFN